MYVDIPIFCITIKFLRTLYTIGFTRNNIPIQMLNGVLVYVHFLR